MLHTYASHALYCRKRFRSERNSPKPNCLKLICPKPRSCQEPSDQEQSDQEQSDQEQTTVCNLSDSGAVNRVGVLAFVPAIALALSVLVSAPVALANNSGEVGEVAKQTVIPGQPFSYRFTSDSIPLEHLRVRLLNKPSGATVHNQADAGPVLHWTPANNVAAENIVIVQSFDARQPQIISTYRLLFERGTVSNPMQLEQASSGAIQSEQAATKPITLLPRYATSTVDAEELLDPAPIKQPPVESFDREKQRPISNDHRPQLPKLNAQLLSVGTEFQLIIRPTDADNDAVTLVAKRLPEGAILDAVFDGGWLLSWTPGITQTGIHEVTLVATEKTREKKRVEQLLLLKVSDPNAQTALVLASAQSNRVVESTNEVTDASDKAPLSSSSTVNFEPLSSQIVSAGRTISFPVITHSEDDAETIVHIDRLPGRASFDLNANGSRTFHWPTTPADQGEHIFRFTAVHSKDASRVAIKEVLIVIGDPAAPGSRPQRTSTQIQGQ